MFRAQTAQNVVILVGLQWFSRILGLVTKVFLARLLFPDDFGIFALATGVIGFVGSVGSFGLDYAIIHKGDRATKVDYDVAMTVRLLISVGLFLASVAVAIPWAVLFKTPAVAPATEVLAIGYLVIPWSFIPQTRLTTELRYRTIAVPNVVGQLVNAFVSVALAFFGFGLWSLVYGLLLGQAVTTIVFVLLRREGFHFALQRSVASPLLRYAQHLITASVLVFLITNIDNFTVGLYLGSTALGFYAVAYSFGSIPAVFLSGPAGSALFPSLTKLQGQADVLRSAYLEGYGYAAAIIAPVSLGMAATAPEIVSILLGGPVWAPATLPLLILAFYGLARGLMDFSASLFAAVGRPRIIAETNLIVLIASLLLLFPLTLAYGIVGTAVAMTIPVAIGAWLSISQSARILEGSARPFYARLRAPLAAAEAMAAVVFVIRLFLYAVLPPRVGLFAGISTSEATIVLLAAIGAGVAVYFVGLRLLDREVSDGLWRHLRLALQRRPELS